MRDQNVARSYAETLFELAERHEGIEAYGEGIRTVARLLDENPDFRLFLKTPRVAAERKKEVVRKAFGGTFPKDLVNFLLVTIDKRRQRLLPDIARHFDALVDEHLNRVHVDVTLARPVDDAMEERMADRLTALLGKTAIPHVRVDPAIVGGIVVRTGHTIYDGSLRRRIEDMRRQLITADLPTPEAGLPAGVAEAADPTAGPDATGSDPSSAG